MGDSPEHGGLRGSEQGLKPEGLRRQESQRRLKEQPQAQGGSFNAGLWVLVGPGPGQALRADGHCPRGEAGAGSEGRAGSGLEDDER